MTALLVPVGGEAWSVPAAPEQRVAAPLLAEPDALQGWTVAVTGVRRSEDLLAQLAQRGAATLHLPALRLVPALQEPLLLQATQECLRAPVDVVVATSGLGFRAWLEAADGWGVGAALRRQLATAQVWARGPKASGAVSAAGFADTTRGTADSTWQILGQLLGTPLRGRRVVVQLHGGEVADFPAVLRAAGAEVVEVPVYRALPPEDPAVLDRLVEAVLQRRVQALTVTCAAALAHLLGRARERGELDPLLASLRGDVTTVCVGAVAAAPLERQGVPTVRPDAARLGALVLAVQETLQARAVRLQVAGHLLDVRGSGALVDGEFRSLPPAPMAVLRGLVARPGHVVAAPDLLALLPGAGQEVHAVEMAVRRLRSGLGDPRCVQNVIKRGYRLAVEGVR